jgi:hypothetical protein
VNEHDAAAEDERSRPVYKRKKLEETQNRNALLTRASLTSVVAQSAVGTDTQPKKKRLAPPYLVARQAEITTC